MKINLVQNLFIAITVAINMYHITDIKNEKAYQIDYVPTPCVRKRLLTASADQSIALTPDRMKGFCRTTTFPTRLICNDEPIYGFSHMVLTGMECVKTCSLRLNGKVLFEIDNPTHEQCIKLDIIDNDNDIFFCGYPMAIYTDVRLYFELYSDIDRFAPKLQFTPWAAIPQIIDAYWFSFITKLIPSSTIRYPRGNYLVAWAGLLAPKERLEDIRGQNLCRSITISPSVYKDRLRVLLYSKKLVEISNLSDKKWFANPPEEFLNNRIPGGYYIVRCDNLFNFIEFVKSIDASASIYINKETFYSPSQQEEMHYYSQQATERSFFLYNYIIGLSDILSPTELLI